MRLSSANRRSNSSTAGPSVSLLDRTSVRMSSRYASRSANCRSRYEKLTCNGARGRPRFDELEHACHNAVALLRGEPMVHRKAEDALRLALGDRKVAGAVTEGPTDRLEMDGDRVMNRGPDSEPVEMCAELVALVGLDHEGVVHVAFVRELVRDHKVDRSTEARPIFGGV